MLVGRPAHPPPADAPTSRLPAGRANCSRMRAGRAAGGCVLVGLLLLPRVGAAMRTPHGVRLLIPTSALDYGGQPEPTVTPSGASSDEVDPLVVLMPSFIWSMPVQVLLGGICLALAFVLGIHLAFTGRYHYPLSKTNFILQCFTSLCLLVSTSSDLGVLLTTVSARSTKFPYMLPYVNMEIPPPTGEWSSARVGCYTILQATVAFAIHTTHIQFLTLLYPSHLERRLVLWMLGPLAVCSAALLFSDLAPFDNAKAIDLSDAFRNICNSTLYLLYLCALLIWGLLVNRRRAWRTDGGTAIFGMGASGLAFVTSMLSFLSIKWDRLWWLPQIGFTLTAWQSWLGFWWWVGAGMGIGEVEDREMRSAKRAARKAQVLRATAQEGSVDDAGLSVEYEGHSSALHRPHEHYDGYNEDSDEDGDLLSPHTSPGSRLSRRPNRHSHRQDDAARSGLRSSRSSRFSRTSVTEPQVVTSSASLAHSTRASIRGGIPHMPESNSPRDLPKTLGPDQHLPTSGNTLPVHLQPVAQPPPHLREGEDTPQFSRHDDPLARREDRPLSSQSHRASLPPSHVPDTSTHETSHHEGAASRLPASISSSSTAAGVLMQATRSATSALPRPAFLTERFRRLRVAHFAAARSAATQQTALRDQVLQKRQQRRAQASHATGSFEESDQTEEVESSSPLENVSSNPVAGSSVLEVTPAPAPRSRNHSPSVTHTRLHPHTGAHSRTRYATSSGRNRHRHSHRADHHRADHHSHHGHRHRRHRRHRYVARDQPQAFPNQEEDYTLPPATPPSGPATSPHRSEPPNPDILPVGPRSMPRTGSCPSSM